MQSSDRAAGHSPAAIHATTLGKLSGLAVQRSMPFAMLGQTILVLWYAGHGIPDTDLAAARTRAPWNRKKTHVSIDDMLIAFRRGPNYRHQSRPGHSRSISCQTRDQQLSRRTAAKPQLRRTALVVRVVVHGGHCEGTPLTPWR